MLCPFVRYIDKRIYDTTGTEPRFAYDFRLFYIHEGDGMIQICGENFPLSAHTIAVIPPAMPYRLMGEQLFLTVLNFDADYRATEREPMPPQSEAHFHRELVHMPPHCDGLDKPLLLSQFPEGEHTLFLIYDEWEKNLLWADERISSLLRGLLILALRRRATPQESLSPLLREVLAYIETHYAEPLSNKEIAAGFHYHPYYLNKRFTAAMGMPLHQYLIKRRIHAAKLLLTQSNESMETISERVGFSSHAHFTKMFREVTGMTPHAFRASKLAEEI